MTVIVATRDAMLADSQTSWGDARTFDRQKICAVRGHLMAASGDWPLVDSFYAAYTAGDTSAFPLSQHGDEAMDALIVAPEGLWWTDHRRMHSHRVDEPVWAIGRGMFVALGALWAGATVLQAMAVACDRAQGCGWPLQWHLLSGEHGEITAEDWRHGMPGLALPEALFACYFPAWRRGDS